jgi:NitT/TauT family transport system substrate-binding protein
MFRTFLFVIVCMTLLVVPAMAQDTPAPVDQTFFMTFVPNVQFAPIYVALEKGYLSAVGINMTIEHGDENVGVELLATNQRQFGLISGEEVLKARANGRPVVSIYEWFQQYPVGIVYPLGQGIESPADLQGRKVGIPGRFGASYNGLTALLSANNLTEQDIQLESIGFNAADVFCVGGVQASVVYINNEPLQIQNRIDRGECQGYSGVGVFRVADNADMVSNGLVTNEETITNNPDLVRAMVSAWDQGVRDSIRNPAEAYLLSAAYVENLPMTDEFRSALEAAASAQSTFLEEASPVRAAVAESRAQLLADLEAQFDADTLLQFRVLLNTIELWDADQPGLATLDSWQQTADVLRAMGALESEVDANTAFSNDFLPG